MPNKQSTNISWSRITLIVVVLAVALAVFFIVRPDERDYRNAESYIGLTESEAIQKAADAGYEIRVIERDGEHLGADADLREDRINFSISNGEVEEAELY